MEANELRIGNWIIKDDGLPERIAGIPNLMAVRFLGFDHSTSISKCNPVPITEEWLNKLGFEKAEPFPGTTEYRFGFNKEMNKNSIVIVKFFSMDVFYYFQWKPAPMKFVHQLQNLTFALTGQELLIKQ